MPRRVSQMYPGGGRGVDCHAVLSLQDGNLPLPAARLVSKSRKFSCRGELQRMQGLGLRSAAEAVDFPTASVNAETRNRSPSREVSMLARSFGGGTQYLPGPL